MQLREDLHYCVVGGRSIFLDLEQNRYFALAKHLDEAFQRLLTDPGSVTVGYTAVTKLLAAGILNPTTNRTRHRETELSLTPRISLYDASGSCTPSWWSASRLIARHLVVIAELRRKPIKHLLQRRAARKQGLPKTVSFSSAHIGAIISNVRTSGKVLSAHGRCLSSSIMVFDELVRRGYRADLFLGVSNTPFAAHCWVQVDDMLVNDTLENVALYTPLLRI